MEKSANIKSEGSRNILSNYSSKSLAVPVSRLSSDRENPCSSTMPLSNTITIQQEKDSPPVKDGSSSKGEPVDIDSVKGIFGWETLDNTSIPYLLRNGRKYVSIRIVERKLLSKYPNTSPDELGKKDPLVSHFITEAEANLLNEINISHCDYEYGQSSFTEKDLVVDLEEFGEFFKIVKKTFPEEILASMKADTVVTSTQPVESSSVVEPAQCCGWIQINNTVSPYIMRGTGKEQVKLVPLSVIIYAAGLLTNADVKGINPSSHECKLLNAACKTAGFDFTFARNTRLIAISEVVQRCQVQIFELPFSNPLQHAHYLDHRIVTPLSQSLSTPLRHPPPAYASRSTHVTPAMPVESMAGRFMNPFMPRVPGHDLTSPLRPGGMMSPVMSFDPRFGPPEKKLSNLDPSQLPASIQQALLDKCHRMDSVMTKMPANSHSSFWSMLSGQPPPAHSGKVGTTSKTPPSPYEAPSPSSTSSYHPLSLPPNPMLHPNSIDMNNSIHRMAGLSSSSQSQSMKDSLLHNSIMSKQGPSPQNQHGPCHSSLGNKQLISSSSSVIVNNSHQTLVSALSKSQASIQTQRISTNNVQSVPLDLVKCISASLVNGKSISCLDVDFPSRRGKFCLVEAVSKLYFPTVPIAEFLKVLQVVLKANLYPCTSEEEVAFVKYYNLPAPRLKCNQMILVDDLKRYFPQLTYVFSRRSAGHSVTQDSNGDRALKRHADAGSVGPPLKQVVQDDAYNMKLDQKVPIGSSSGTSNGNSKTSSVIVIDD